MKLFDTKQRAQTMGLGNLSSAAIGVVVFIIVVAIGATVLDEMKDTQTANSVAENTTEAGLAGLELFGDFTSIIVIVAIAAVILALIAVAFRQFA